MWKDTLTKGGGIYETDLSNIDSIRELQATIESALACIRHPKTALCCAGIRRRALQRLVSEDTNITLEDWKREQYILEQSISLLQATETLSAYNIRLCMMETNLQHLEENAPKWLVKFIRWTEDGPMLKEIAQALQQFQEAFGALYPNIIATPQPEIIAQAE